MLVERVEEERHAIGLDPQRRRELGRVHDFEVVRAIEVGGAVRHRARRGPDRLEDLERRGLHVFAAGEHHVLEQMRETALPRRLIRGAHVVPDVDRDLRQPVIFAEDHRQPVRELVLLELDLDVGGVRPKRRKSEERTEGRTEEHAMLHARSC